MDVKKSLMDSYLQQSHPVITMPHDLSAFKPLKEVGQRLIVAGDGLYKEVRRAWLHAIVRIGVARTPFGALAEQAVMPFEIPQDLLYEFVQQAHAAAPMETAAWIVWNAYSERMYLLPMTYDHVSSVHLTIQRPELADGEHLVVDLHSHHSMPAWFSREDDADDILSNEVKIAGVLGTIDTDPTWDFRLCVEGVLMDDVANKMKIRSLHV